MDLTYFVCKLMQQHSVTVGKAIECKPTRSYQIMQGCLQGASRELCTIDQPELHLWMLLQITATILYGLFSI